MSKNHRPLSIVAIALVASWASIAIPTAMAEEAAGSSSMTHKNDVMGVESHSAQDEKTGSKIQGGESTHDMKQPKAAASPMTHKDDVMGKESHSAQDEKTGGKIQGGESTHDMKTTPIGKGSSGD